ncbi:MAG: TRAP transporter small permease [Chloroflexota bacterium]
MGALGFLIRNFEEIVVGVFMTLMSLATFSNVVARYLFNSPIQWAEEFSRYAFIWIVFMGAAICTKRKRHIVIDGFVLAMPKRLRPLFALLADLMVLVLMAAVIYYSVILARSATQPTATLQIPQYVVYSIVPVSGALILLYSLRDLKSDLRSLLSGGEQG